jgi:hypothetical protein
VNEAAPQQAAPASKHWTGNAAWHILAWVFAIFCAPVTVACIVIGIIRAAKGHGHDLWISSVCAFVFGVAVSLAIRLM